MSSEIGLKDFIAGWVGGICSVVIGYPFDTVKVRQQNFSTSFLMATRDTLRYEGPLGFFKGMSSPLVAYGPSNSIFFGFTGLSMHILHENMQPSRFKYLLDYYISGSVGGLMQATFMCPVEMVKIVLQTSTGENSPWVHNNNVINFNGSIDTYQKIIKLYGVLGLYRGFGPMLIRDVPTGGIYFVVYEVLLPENRKEIQWYHKVWAGGLAGIASISSVLPVDVVKTRMQADDVLNPIYDGMLHCFRKLYREEGARIFWKGLPVITFRAFPSHAVLFVGYEATIDFLGTSR